MISLRGRHGRSFHRWRIVAVFVHGELTSGKPGDLDKRYKFHVVESR